MSNQWITVNGFEITMVECSRLWAAMRIGVKRGGWTFRTKRAAIKWASAQVAA